LYLLNNVYASPLHDVSGSPFKFNVRDIRKVKTRGDGLATVECNRLSTFIIAAPEAQLTDIDVLITGTIYSKRLYERKS
jgi:hypothetical protein